MNIVGQVINGYLFEEALGSGSLELYIEYQRRERYMPQRFWQKHIF